MMKTRVVQYKIQRLPSGTVVRQRRLTVDCLTPDFLFIFFIKPHPAKHSITRETQKQIKQLCGINGRQRAIPLTCSQNDTRHMEYKIYNIVFPPKLFFCQHVTFLPLLTGIDLKVGHQQPGSAP